MANDQVMMEIARALGRRLLVSRDKDEERLQYAFELCFSRPPDAVEMKRLGGYLAEQRSVFAAPELQEAASAKFAGDDGPLSASSEAAAWTAVSRLLINLDEFITRE